MECYNITVLKVGQALATGGSPAPGAHAIRWPDSDASSRPCGAALGAAVLLHLTAYVILLAFGHWPAAPKVRDDQVVALMFVPTAAPLAVVPPVPGLVAPVPASPPDPPAAPVPVDVAPLLPETPSAPAVPGRVLLPPPVPSPAPSPAGPRRAAAAATPHTPPAAATPAGPGAAEGLPHTAAPAPVAAAPIPGDWQRALAGWLAAHKTYPDEARRRGVEGSVVMRFSVDRSGRVFDVVLVDDAGSAVLGAAAEAMLRGATLPPFTAAMPQNRVTVTVRVRYTLSN